VAFLVFVAILIVIVGLWRGWFTIFVNQPQIQHDEKKAQHAIEKTVDKIEAGIHKGTEKVEEKTSN
jgi:uncharacterized membrane protein